VFLGFWNLKGPRKIFERFFWYRRPAAADQNWPFVGASRCHCCCVGLLILLQQFSMTKKGHQKDFEDRTKFFRESLKDFFGTGVLPPTTKIDQRAAADTMTLAHDSRSGSGQPWYLVTFSNMGSRGLLGAAPYKFRNMVWYRTYKIFGDNVQNWNPR